MRFLILFLALGAVLRAASVTGVDGLVVSVENPARIVALNTSTIEILAALGEDGRIVGVDTSGVALMAGREGIANFGHPYRPNIEAIIASSPDLVIATADSFQNANADQLRAARVPVLILESSSKDGPEGLKRRIAVVAELFDKAEAGRELNASIDRRLAALRAKVEKADKKPRVFFLYTHGPGHAVIYGRNTGSHWLIELAGGINAADFTEGTKPLTPEAMVQSAPEVFVLLERGLKAIKGPEGIRSLPGAALTPAGRERRVLSADDSIRWIGPRFIDHVEKLHGELYPES